MRPIGFSTGALAYSNFQRALQMLRNEPIEVVELSALRSDEVEPLVQSLDALDLSQFSYVSFHAPSSFDASREPGLIEMLAESIPEEWPIILHPDAAANLPAWRQLGARLLIENMDKRKPTGRTAQELCRIFELLPKACLCFDIGHARQVDPTMIESMLILKQFGNRLREVHVSEVNTQSRHCRLSETAILAFQKLADLIPAEIPLILETPVEKHEIESELTRARLALPISEFRQAAV